jgi:hypothetical protein
MKPRRSALTAIITVAALGGAAPAALAAPASHPSHVAPTIFANRGADQPSVSVSVSPTGEAEIASVGAGGSLWFSYFKSGKWHRSEAAKPGSAFSGPSLVAGPSGAAVIAVEGPDHTLWVHGFVAGHWHSVRVSGPGTAYSAPSLDESAGGAGLAVEGPHHSLYFDSLVSLTHFARHKVGGNNDDFSAPSLVIRGPDQVSSGHPEGEVDIAVENNDHALSYFSNPGSGWNNDVIGGPGSAYSAPSLVVSTGFLANEGAPYILVQGPHHSMFQYLNDTGTFQKDPVAGNGKVFSAPSVQEGDAVRSVFIAFRGVQNSVSVYYWRTVPGDWVNDVIVKASGTVDSAPALFYRTGSGENDVVFQGSHNTLWYYHAKKPAAADLGPSFAGHRVAGPGTTFGG